jgi:hypothetical protein
MSGLAEKAGGAIAMARADAAQGYPQTRQRLRLVVRAGWHSANHSANDARRLRLGGPCRKLELRRELVNAS